MVNQLDTRKKSMSYMYTFLSHPIVILQAISSLASRGLTSGFSPPCEETDGQGTFLAGTGQVMGCCGLGSCR